MCEQVNINVQETNETINIVSSEIQEVIDINVFETTEDVTLNITEEIIQVNINKVTGGGGEQTLAETLVLGNNTGGTDILLNNADAILLENNSSIRKGTYDFGQNGGVSRICGVDYEDMWQGGIRHVFDNNGYIRNSTNCFNVVPDNSFDVTLRFKVGSIWTLDDGTNYICTDATEGAAVWELYNVIPTATSDLTNDGEDGVNPFITAEDLPSLTGYVPYTGATQNVDLGEYELKAGQVTLDVSPTGTASVGTTRWNNTIGSSETTLKGGSVILKNGVDLVARVVNKVTPNATLTRATYHAVRVSGAQGQRLAVAYAQANSDNNSADTIGLVCEDIATNQQGFIITVGQLEEINTTGSLQGETWADGDVLYLSPTTAGHITNIKPNGATGHIVVMGYVEYAHANHGKIYVKIMNGWELDELHNVYINAPVNRDLLAYNSSTDLWENKSFRKQSLGGAQFFTDFISAGSATPNLAVTTSGTGASTTKSTTTAAPNQTVNQIGLCQYQTGTTATGFAAHINDNQGALAFTFGGGSWVYETFIEVDTLSTLTEQFRFITGFATQASVINEVNAIIFTYDSGGLRNGTTASANWQCVTSDNSTRTLTTTSVAVTTTWTKLRIEINADATEVKFYINDNLVATHTQNIPKFSNSRFLIMKQQLVKSAGTTNRSVYCDYLLYENNLTTLR